MRAINRILLGLVLVLAVACSRTPDRGPVRPAPGPGATPLLGDSQPHSWDGLNPYGQEVHGIDVSRWQGDVDWEQVRTAGISFAFIKATEGADFVDPNFRRYWDETARARIPRGAYHYFYFCRSGVEQAQWFMQQVPREIGSMPPVIDLEWTVSRTCPRRPPPNEIKREAAIFMEILARHYGQRPIIYTTVDFYRDNALGDMQAEFWLRSVSAHPSVRYPGQRWAFWQYTGTGLVPGIQGNTDLNAFAGTRADWVLWLQTRLTR